WSSACLHVNQSVLQTIADHTGCSGLHSNTALALNHLLQTCTLASSANRSSVSRSCVRDVLTAPTSKSASTFDRRPSSPGVFSSTTTTDLAYSSASLPARPN